MRIPMPFVGVLSKVVRTRLVMFYRPNTHIEGTNTIQIVYTALLLFPKDARYSMHGKHKVRMK